MKWRVLAILVFGTFALIAGCIWLASKAVPAVLGAAVGLVPVSWEKQLGEATVEQTTRLFRRCEESSTVEPIAAIVLRLESGMAPHPYRFRVLVVDSAEVNAFAAPGGSIVVYRGLIEKMQAPEELAAVLAHEMQHVVQRHSTRAMLRVLGLQVGLTILVGDPGVIGDLAARLGVLHLMRSDEQSADDRAVEALMKAEIDPAAMQRAFSHLAAVDPLRGAPSALQYLSTHPPIEERAARIAQLARNWHGPAKPLAVSLPTPCAGAR